MTAMMENAALKPTGRPLYNPAAVGKGIPEVCASPALEMARLGRMVGMRTDETQPVHGERCRHGHRAVTALVTDHGRVPVCKWGAW